MERTKSPANAGLVKSLERETGVEPATSTLARSHSTTELLPLVLSFYSTCTFPDNSLHPHWHPLFVIRLFHIGYSTTVRQETLDELTLGVPWETFNENCAAYSLQHADRNPRHHPPNLSRLQSGGC